MIHTVSAQYQSGVEVNQTSFSSTQGFSCGTISATEANWRATFPMSSPTFVDCPSFTIFPASYRRKRVAFSLCATKPQSPSHPKSLQSKSPPKRRYRYWSSLSNTISELEAYLNGSQTLPTLRELEKAGRYDLASGLRRHGWSYISSVTGLPLASVARPRSLHLVACTPSPPLRMRPYMYWRDFRNLENALRPYVRDGGLPTARQLIDAQRSDLVRAIRKHGGWKAVAHRMGVRQSSKPDWSTLSVVQEEIRRAMNRANENESQLPNVSILKKFGTRGLLHAIRTHHGGMARVVGSMYEPENDVEHVTRKPRGYWTKKQLESEVRQCAKTISERNEPVYMPTAAQFRSINKSDVLSAVQRAGGIRRMAEACGLRCRRKPQSKGMSRGT